MGYISRDIAQITEPKTLTLAALPNFVTFTSKPYVTGPVTFLLTINMLPSTTMLELRSEFVVTEPSGVANKFSGTTDPAKVGGSVFYVSANRANTAENMRTALLNNKWIAANFDIRIPFTWVGATPTNGVVLNFRSKGYGPDYNASFTAPNNVSDSAYNLSGGGPSTNTDTISNTPVEIELDIYTDPAVFLGQTVLPVTLLEIGNYAVSLQKTYTGSPLWFELNSIFQHYAGHNVPPVSPGWFDAGTVRAYRFVAKKMGLDSFAFYQSDALFVLNGYGRASDPINLAQYTYGSTVFKLLTNRPQTNYVRGQKEYLNFIFSDAERGVGGAPNYTLRVAYTALSTSGAYLGTVYAHAITRTSLRIVNTCVLDIPAVLAAYPSAGFVNVSLVQGTAELTNTIQYRIMPDCLHKVNEFVFLNRLGGWDSFNFDAEATDEIKTESETYNRNLTPAHTKSTGKEIVYTTDLENSITVDGAPVTDDVAEWLKELAASRVVLDGQGNYLIIEDFKLRVSPDSANMQIPTLKYRLSENYNNE